MNKLDSTSPMIKQGKSLKKKKKNTQVDSIDGQRHNLDQYDWLD